MESAGREWGDGGTGSSAGGVRGGGAKVSETLGVGTARRARPVSVTASGGGRSKVASSPKNAFNQGFSLRIASASLAFSSLEGPERPESDTAERL